MMLPSRIRAAVVAVLAAAGSLTVALIGAPSPAAAVTAPSGCTIGAPQVPLTKHSVAPFLAPFATLTATNNHGTWAGLRSAGDFTLQVISWRAGRTTVLDTIDYSHVGFDPLNSVQVIGVSDDGSVVVKAKNPRPVLPQTLGLRYQNGHRYELAHSSAWLRVEPTSVAPDGLIAGEAYARQGGGIVEWTGAGAGKLVMVSTHGANPLLDQYDDYIWSEARPAPVLSVLRVRTRAGRIFNLGPNEDGYASLQIAAGRYVWGTVNGSYLALWDLAAGASLPSGATLAALHIASVQGSYVRRAAPSGANFVEEVNGPLRYQDAWGDFHSLPPMFFEPGDHAYHYPRAGIATDATIAITGTDGNVRFLKCALSSVGHEPVGRLYAARASGNSVTITGGGLDPDLRTAPINVDIYDQTRTKTFVGRYLANQTNTSPDATWYRLSHQSFTATFTTNPGTHKYCAYGLNLRAGSINSALFCTTVTVAP